MMTNAQVNQAETLLIRKGWSSIKIISSIRRAKVVYKILATCESTGEQKEFETLFECAVTGFCGGQDDKKFSSLKEKD